MDLEDEGIPYSYAIRIASRLSCLEDAAFLPIYTTNHYDYGLIPEAYI